MDLNKPYPGIIEKLPDVDYPLDGVRGKLLQAGDYQIAFYDVDPIGELPPHSGAAQWGIVVEGEMELIVDGELRTVKQGDSYYLPAGSEHSVTFRTHVRVLDLYAEPNRRQVKAK